MNVEHRPWLPTVEGLDGQKIAIVGYSHHCDGPDSDDLTDEVVGSFVRGEHRFQFFRAIQGYFGFAHDAAFWRRVMFFNFLPNCVGPRSEKYAEGTTDQLRRGGERFMRLLKDHRPDKVFVFTTKGWRAFPEKTVEELAGRRCTPLMPGSPEPNWGTYEICDHRVLVCGIRHPQFAKQVELTEQVQTFLSLRPE